MRPKAIDTTMVIRRRARAAGCGQWPKRPPPTSARCGSTSRPRWPVPAKFRGGRGTAPGGAAHAPVGPAQAGASGTVQLAPVALRTADPPVGCSNLGDLAPAVNRPDGTDADYMSIRAFEPHIPTPTVEARGG